MINEIREIEVGNKKFELKRIKGGECVGFVALHAAIVEKANVDFSTIKTDAEAFKKLSIGMRREFKEDIKYYVLESVVSPVLTSETYDELSPQEIIQLFWLSALFNFLEDEKKNQMPTE